MTFLNFPFCSFQAKKKFFDTELENLERQQKQQVEKMEQDHAVRRREEAKRIRLEQERDYAKFQEQLKLMKKEVNTCWVEAGVSRRIRTLPVASNQNPTQPGLRNRGNLGELVCMKSSHPAVSGSTPSRCASRSPFPVIWALLSSVWIWFQAGPRHVASGSFLYIPPA